MLFLNACKDFVFKENTTFHDQKKSLMKLMFYPSYVLLSVVMEDELAPEEAPPTEALPEEEPPAPEVSTSRDPNRRILYRHWSRPTSLQYNYIYDYRRNYYDDVIDYLDRKTKGLNRDIPRAQTWAERVLRTYTKDTKSAAFQSRHRDVELLNSIRASNCFYRLHNRDYLIKRYPVFGL
jgi:hypothetical protein